jgi:intracellular septation protein
MKFLFDLLPVILFFSAYQYYKGHKEAAAELLNSLFASAGLVGGFLPEQSSILVATLVVILATAGQVGWLLLRKKHVDKMLWISLGLIVVMGGATLWLRDPVYLKWKFTVVEWLFAVVLLVSAIAFDKNLIRKMLDEHVVLPDAIWLRLNLAWVAFFVFMGLLNLYIAFSFSEEIWVAFKLYGGMGLMILFIIAQGLFLAKYITDKPEEKT